jgi:hypothetical protein
MQSPALPRRSHSASLERNRSSRFGDGDDETSSRNKTDIPGVGSEKVLARCEADAV